MTSCTSGVGVAQLAEHWIVAPVVAGSSPVAHPPEINGLHGPPVCVFRDCLTLQLLELTVSALIPWEPSGATSTSYTWAASARATRRDNALCACHGKRHDNSNTAA